MTNPNQQTVSIAVSLAEIHAALCPACQQAVIDLLSAKAGVDLFRQAIHQQLVGAHGHAPPESPLVAPPDGTP
jgi:hypothetical protein